jgi:hypothetical protein
MTRTEAQKMIDRALDHALGKHRRKFASAHEGYAVLLEEVEELWEAIRHDRPADAAREAAQVGAMAQRFLMHCWPGAEERVLGGVDEDEGGEAA